MSKGYILVDVPEKCKKCRFYYPARDMHTGEYVSGCRMIPTMVIREPEKKPDWCPIRELPQKMEVCGKYPQPGKPVPSYRIGWNKCIEQMEGDRRMREILSKAKWLDNGEWVEGYYAKLGYGKNVKHFIIQNVSLQEDISYFEDIEIDPETLCRFTGLPDKNNQKIYENDIVEIAGEDGYFKCEWEEDTLRFVLNGDGLTVDFDNYYGYECEVVGNIFDNPDLLEVE